MRAVSSPSRKNCNISAALLGAAELVGLSGVEQCCSCAIRPSEAASRAGRYCLIDMHIAPGGGPPTHRHDFEEMFTILQGEVEVTFRGKKSVVRAGEPINIPANAP